MKQLLLSAFVLAFATVVGSAAEFKSPIRLRSGNEALRAESPGYASPCWADFHGDGKMHLLVGQFRGGKLQVFKHLDGEKFEPGSWVQAAGSTAEIPGVY